MTFQSNAIYTMRYPNALFQNLKDGVLPVKTAVINGIAVAANQQLVAAVTGKKILVVGGNCFSNGAYTQVTFKSGSGGTVKRIIAVPANTVATPNVQIVPTEYDIFETDAGVGLYADNSAVIAITTINYIEYTP